jgi:Holliday junction resolvase RusA-like endonuclease
LITFTVPGAPLGQNALYRIVNIKPRGGKAHSTLMMTSAGRAWKTDIAARAGLAPHLGEALVEVRLRVYLPNERMDLDGPIKPVMDALQGVKMDGYDGRMGGCIVNDRQVRRLVVERYVDRERPRIEIDVEPLTGKEG